MNILTLDAETTISNNGHWADQSNRLVVVGLKWLGDIAFCYYPHSDLEEVQKHIDGADIIVGFNIKFDLHWLRNYGIDFNGKKIWDCQIAEFLFSSQKNVFPSLDKTLSQYSLESKLDVVKTEYWDKGIDTDKIPVDILREYLVRDLEATEQVFFKQKELFKQEHKSKYKLFQIQCEDLKVLQEMEYNGLRFNATAAREEAKHLECKLEDLQRRISEIVGLSSDIPFNLNSNDHLSAILYGGDISWTIKVPDGVYKTGKRVGQIKYKNQDVSKSFDRLVEPLDKTETKKSRKLSEDTPANSKTWSVSEDVLRQLKAKGKAKELIDNILEYSKIEKLKGTYLEGYSNLIEKMNWPTDMLHGNLNQCSVVTGRLSSTKPNLQNIDPQTKKFLESRYEVAL